MSGPEFEYDPLSDCFGKYARLKKENERLETENKELKKESDKYLKWWHDLRKENKRLEAENKKLKAKLNNQKETTLSERIRIAKCRFEQLCKEVPGIKDAEIIRVTSDGIYGIEIQLNKGHSYWSVIGMLQKHISPHVQNGTVIEWIERQSS